MDDRVASSLSEMEVGIASLPNELLTEIFKLLCKSSKATSNGANVSNFPILLTHVNRHWRELAISLSSLWTEIYVSQYDADILNTMFHRSRGHPLDIVLNFPKATPPGANLRLWKTLITVLSQMGRCCSLTVSTISANYDLIRRIFPSNCAAPMLKSLNLICLDFQSVPSIFPAFAFDPEVFVHLSVDGVVLPNCDVSSVERMELRNTESFWLENVEERSKLQKLSLFNVFIPWSLDMATRRLNHMTLDAGSLSIFDSNVDFSSLICLEITATSPIEWHAVIDSIGKTSQSQKFAEVNSLVLSRFDGDPVVSGLLSIELRNALPRLAVIEFLQVNPGSLAGFIRDYSTIWPNTTVIVDCLGVGVGVV